MYNYLSLLCKMLHNYHLLKHRHVNHIIHISRKYDVSRQINNVIIIRIISVKTAKADD